MCDTFWDDPDCAEFYLDMKAGLYDNTEDEEEEMSDPDTNEILFKAADGNSYKRIMDCQDADETWHEHHGWNGKCFYDDNEPTKDQDVILWLRSENAYLRGKIEAYEKFLKDRGYIKEEE